MPCDKGMARQSEPRKPQPPRVPAGDSRRACTRHQAPCTPRERIAAAATYQLGRVLGQLPNIAGLGVALAQELACGAAGERAGSRSPGGREAGGHQHRRAARPPASGACTQPVSRRPVQHVAATPKASQGGRPCSSQERDRLHLTRTLDVERLAAAAVRALQQKLPRRPRRVGGRLRSSGGRGARARERGATGFSVWRLAPPANGCAVWNGGGRPFSAGLALGNGCRHLPCAWPPPTRRTAVVASASSAWSAPLLISCCAHSRRPCSAPRTCAPRGPAGRRASCVTRCAGRRLSPARAAGRTGACAAASAPKTRAPCARAAPWPWRRRCGCSRRPGRPDQSWSAAFLVGRS